MSVTKSDPHQGSWFSIFLVYAVGVLGATTVSQAITVARDIVAFFHAAPTQAGWIISTPSALTAVGAVWTGWLVDRIGDKRILIVGCVFVIAGDVGVTCADSMEKFLAMRIAEGIGYVCLAVSAVTMMMRITHGPRRNIALALWSSFIPMSFALPLVLTAPLAGTGQWRWAFSGHAIVLGVLGLLALVILPATEVGGAKRTSGLATVLRSPGPYLLGLAFASHAFIQTGIVSTLPHTLIGLYHVNFPIASTIITLGMLLNVIGCLVVGPLINRGVRSLSISIAGAVGVVAGGIGVGMELPALGAAVAFACLFFFASGLISGLWALLPLVAPGPQTRGATSGLVTQVTLFGVLFGPPAAFAAQASGGWSREALNIAMAGSAMLLLLWLVIGKFTTKNASIGVGEPAQSEH